jgi:hypothetical protein
MIFSKTPIRMNSHWSRACALLCAIAVLSVGVTHAQDFEAVGKRLRAAVAAGELTAEQAGIMMGALRKSVQAGQHPDMQRVKAHLENVKTELATLIEAGKISKEEAEKKFVEAEKAIKERIAAARREAQAIKDQKADDVHTSLLQLRKKLGAAVEAGKISQEDAEKKFAEAEKALKQKMAAALEHSSKKISEGDLERVGIEIRKAIAAGKLSPEAGRAKLETMRKMLAKQREGADQKITREKYGKIEAELKKLLAKGMITKEDMKARLDAARREMAEQARESAERDFDWENVKQRIEGAVKRGDLTREEAEAKYKEIRKRLAEERGP